MFGVKQNNFASQRIRIFFATTCRDIIFFLQKQYFLRDKVLTEYFFLPISQTEIFFQSNLQTEFFFLQVKWMFPNESYSVYETNHLTHIDWWGMCVFDSKYGACILNSTLCPILLFTSPWPFLHGNTSVVFVRHVPINKARKSSFGAPRLGNTSFWLVKQ